MTPKLTRLGELKIEAEEAGMMHPSGRTSRVKPRRRCQYCGQPFVSRVKATRFCSRDCARLFRLARLI